MYSIISKLTQILQNIIKQMEDLKAVKAHYLYNMLQDFRHIVIFDLRKEIQFDQSHIRESFNFNENINKQQAQQFISLAIKKADQKQKKYSQLKKVRRYFIIDSTQIDLKKAPEINIDKIKFILSKIPKDPVNKIYFLSGGYKQYFQAYPFTCLVKANLQKLRAQNASQTQQQRWLLYPYCRFPTQIIPGKLYLGNIFSSNSQKQLQDLRIKHLIDFIDYKESGGTQEAAQEVAIQNNQIPAFKLDESKYSYLQLPFNQKISVNIDFDLINQQIEKKVSQDPTLLYCKDGETISAAFTISYLMYKANLDVTMATLKVCQAISRTDITKWIYTQLLVYKPKKTK